MPVLIRPEGVLLEHILQTEYSIWPEGLSRPAFATFHAAQTKTAWALRHQRRYALVAGGKTNTGPFRIEEPMTAWEAEIIKSFPEIRLAALPPN